MLPSVLFLSTVQAFRDMRFHNFTDLFLSSMIQVTFFSWLRKSVSFIFLSDMSFSHPRTSDPNFCLSLLSSHPRPELPLSSFCLSSHRFFSSLVFYKGILSSDILGCVVTHLRNQISSTMS